MNAPPSTPTRWLWLLPILAVLIAYSPAFDGEFVWDDQNAWQNELPGFRSAMDVLRPPEGIPTWTYSYYRPVVVATYLLDITIGGPASPRIPHAANLAYHALTTWFLWLILRRLLQQRPGAAAGALIGALVFAVHPIHTESVSWIAGRSDLLATMFLVAAAGVALRGIDTGAAPAILFSPLLCLLAVTSKEIAAVGLVLVPLTLLLAPQSAGKGRGSPASRWRLLGAGYLAACAAYLWLRHWAGVLPGVSQGFAPGEAALRMLRAAGYYASRLVVPWSQSSLVNWDMVPGALASVAIVGSGLLLMAAGYHQWRRRGDGMLLLGVAWFWVAIAIPLWSAVGPISKTPLAERHLYLPSVGASIVVAWAFCAAAVRGWERIGGVAAAVLVFVFSVATFQRGLVWRDDLALWSDTVQKVPDRGLAWMNLALSQWRAGDADAARISLERVLENMEDSQVRSRAGALLGTILLRKGDPDAAEPYLRRAIAAWPESAEPYYGLACVSIARTRAATSPADRDAEAALAMRFLRRALDRNPGYHVARLELAGFSADYADSLLGAGDSQRAATLYDEARRELDTLEASLPPLVRPSAYSILRREIGVDAVALRERLERATRPPEG